MSNDYWKFKKNKTRSYIADNKPMEIKQTTDMWTYDKGKTPSVLRIAGWNANGVRSLFNQRRLIPYLEKNSIDIICLS